MHRECTKWSTTPIFTHNNSRDARRPQNFQMNWHTTQPARIMIHLFLCEVKITASYVNCLFSLLCNAHTTAFLWFPQLSDLTVLAFQYHGGDRQNMACPNSHEYGLKKNFYILILDFTIKYRLLITPCLSADSQMWNTVACGLKNICVRKISNGLCANLANW